ncbi:hypothetical protein F4777DRAFT_531029 [Nemania sp. FL0916]|nr:hypothetical protein F4777DRAFT_531029 [Nemania sp. FL0916]
MSADLFAAFEDHSQPTQQTASNPSSAPSASTPFSFASPEASQSRNQLRPSPNHSSYSWQTDQLTLAPNARPASATASVSGNVQHIDNADLQDDDGWGDFETAPDASIPSAATPTLATAKESTLAQINNSQRTRIVRASTLELVSNSLVDFQEPAAPPSKLGNTSFPPAKRDPRPLEPGSRLQMNTANRSPNVLFDADDFEGQQSDEGSDDDFGDFETVQPPAELPSDLLSNASSAPSSTINTAKKASELLLELDINEPTSNRDPLRANIVQPSAVVPTSELNKPRPHPREAHSSDVKFHSKAQALDDDWNSLPGLSKRPVKSPPTKKASMNRANQLKTIESNWDWDSVEPSKTAENRPDTKKGKIYATQNEEDTFGDEDIAWDWDPVATKAEAVAEATESALPPINIPPPSILLSAFPQLFDQANEYLYKPISGQPQRVKDRVLNDAKVYDFLRGFLSLAVVAARIVAGRKMRWHRDKFLSQSMSISAAGSKGMKLAGVDKAQAAREDREAADIVERWKSQVGLLRSMVASTNSARGSGEEQLKIPEIADTTQVQTAKGVPTAMKACVVCGLKRNERLARVDYDVEDSFGEWWTEHWGHVACKRFWLQHENLLRQR